MLVVVTLLLLIVTVHLTTSLFFMKRTHSLAVVPYLERTGGLIVLVTSVLTSNSLIYAFKLRGWGNLAPLFVSSEAIALASI